MYTEFPLASQIAILNFPEGPHPGLTSASGIMAAATDRALELGGRTAAQKALCCASGGLGLWVGDW